MTAAFIMFVQLTELAIYTVINSYIANHDRLMLRSKVISRETFKNRQRCHIFSLTAQMSHFIVEMSYSFSMNVAVVSAFGSSSRKIFVIISIFKILSFGLHSTVQVMCSSDLRSKLFSSFKKQRL